MRRKISVFSAFIFLIDLVSKLIIMHYETKLPIVVIDNFFSITKVTNYGAAFSMFSGFTIFLILVGFLVLFYIYKYLLKDVATKLELIAYSLVIGGILGNLFDRIFYGKVRLDYEYKSKTKIKGIPLVHINLGFGIRRAKGIIAIGNIAQGLFAIGGIAMGLLALGGIPLGLISLGGIAIALFLAFGGLALAPVAIGGLAIGIISIGGLAIGMYSFGGAALASNIGVGGYASGHIAVGEQTSGDIIFNTAQELSKENIVNVVLQEFPKIPKFLLSLIKMTI